MARWLLDELLSDFLISDAYVNQPVSGSPSTDTGAGGALSSRTGMAQYSQHHLRRRGRSGKGLVHEKRPQTYKNIHHHHPHATTMTVMLVPRRPASEKDIKHT